MTKNVHNIYEEENVHFSCLRLQAHYFFNLKFPPCWWQILYLKMFFKYFRQKSLCFLCLEKWVSKLPLPW